ncbi:MAG: hypothetical protein H6742_10440 [Alphaproteobacteria bacterium]|nr:hypothetical protein [Alphaproteobacteria bacterium]
MSGWLLLALACGAGGDDTGDAADGGLDSATEAFCQDAPVVTWNSFGQGFTTEACQTCHASTTAERNGAPDSVTFDTLDDVRAHSDRILARATGDEPDMPPRGGVSDDDRARLEIWLRCWLEEE